MRTQLSPRQQIEASGQKHTKTGFLGFRKPLRKESRDKYESVLVPLAQAKRHDVVMAGHESRRSAESSDSWEWDPLANSSPKPEPDTEGSSGEKAILRTNSEMHNPSTIEGLRAEVMGDVAALGHSSSYDREFNISFFGPVISADESSKKHGN